MTGCHKETVGWGSDEKSQSTWSFMSSRQWGGIRTKKSTPMGWTTSRRWDGVRTKKSNLMEVEYIRGRVNFTRKLNRGGEEAKGK